MRRSLHRSRFGYVLAAAAVWPVLLVQSAKAQGADGGSTAGANKTSDFCAPYGTGFVRLQGTNTCVRIGGHVRVGTTMDGSEQFEWATGSFTAAPGQEAPPSHVRLDSTSGASEFR
jgi:hypothetical protein